MKQIIDIALADQDAEVVRRSHRDAIRELQSHSLAGAVVLKDVVLGDGTATTIAHRLGRRYSTVFISPPRGAVSTGRIDESRDGTAERAKFVKLTASGYGGAITVDLVIL